MLRLTESVDAGKAAAAAAGGMCDVVAQGPICVEGGKKVLTADAASHSLLAHFTFDDAYGLDTSGAHNHATRAPAFGPGVGGHGHAARYAGTDYSEVGHTAAFSDAGASFTVEMWLYLRQVRRSPPRSRPPLSLSLLRCFPCPGLSPCARHRRRRRRPALIESNTTRGAGLNRRLAHCPPQGRARRGAHADALSRATHARPRVFRLDDRREPANGRAAVVQLLRAAAPLDAPRGRR
jgi:hypothetical protein